MASIAETNVKLSLDSSRFTTGIRDAQNKWELFSHSMNKLADFSKFAQGIDFSRFEKGNAILEGLKLGTEFLSGFGGMAGVYGQIASGILSTYEKIEQKEKERLERREAAQKSGFSGYFAETSHGLGTELPELERFSNAIRAATEEKKELFGATSQALIRDTVDQIKNAKNETEGWAIAYRRLGNDAPKFMEQMKNGVFGGVLSDDIEALKKLGKIPKNLDIEAYQKNFPREQVQRDLEAWGLGGDAHKQEMFNMERTSAIQAQAREQVAREDRIKAINKEVEAMTANLKFEAGARMANATEREKAFTKLRERAIQEGGGFAGMGELLGEIKDADRQDRLRNIMGGDDKTRFEKMKADAEFFRKEFLAGNVTSKKFQEVLNQQISGLGDTPRATIPGSSGGVGFNSREAVNAIIDATTRESPARDRIQEQQLREQRDMRRHLEDIRDNTRPAANVQPVKVANF